MEDVSHTMLSSASVSQTIMLPQTMLSSMAAAQAMVLLAPVPQTMFCAQACWFTLITSAPARTLVPQTMFWAHATFSVPYAVCGSIVVVVHVEPTASEVSVLYASTSAP